MVSQVLPRAEMLLLATHVSGWSREHLLTEVDWIDRLPNRSEFDSLAARRLAGEPMAYLLGKREFYGRRFAVDTRVLIPRPETEHLVDRALAWLDAQTPATCARRVLDLGTGSGVIAITLALERRTLIVDATDASPDALLVARSNAEALAARVRFHEGDWYAALGDPQGALYDAIVSNPPYVAAIDPHLAEGDLRFEPRAALTDGDDGLGALLRIVSEAPSHLLPGGWLGVEHGHDQGETVRTLFGDAGFVGIETDRDLAGLERVTHGMRLGA